nr:HAMP domain-containing histidine kinase [candidate division Zixibacteria bacterium]
MSMKLALFLFYILGVAAVTSVMAAEQYIIDPIDDPLVLPYRFLTKIRNTNRNGDICIPVDLNNDERPGMAAVGQNWRPPDTLSCLIFYTDIYRSRAIRHFNMRTLRVDKPFAYDFNGDGNEEIAVTYTAFDSLWFEVYNVDSGLIYRRCLVTGDDLDSNGYWDGTGDILAAHDLNEDGRAEILIGFDTGYDLYPRGIMCLDIFRNQVLWQYNIAGIVNDANFHIIRDPEQDGFLIIFGISSKGNAVREKDMDDQHTYLVVLDGGGKEKWKVVAGETFSGTNPVLVDYDGDGRPEILTDFYFSKDTAGMDIPGGRGWLGLYSLDGKELQKINPGPERQVFVSETLDLDGDNIDEIIFDYRDNYVYVYDRSINLIKVCSLYVISRILDCRSFLGGDDRQLLFATGDNRLLLTDINFKPLAITDSKDNIRVSTYFTTGARGGSAREHILINNDFARENYIFGFQKAPWFTIFSRHPILAFLAAFIPLSIIIGVVWLILAKFRAKNKIISRQKNELDKTLLELKKTQEKLIAAEKYRLARDIAGGVAHEIRNALYPAGSLLDKLQDLLQSGRIEDPERIQRLLEMIGGSIKNANKMIDLVTQYSKLESERRTEAINLQQVLHAIIEQNADRIKEQEVQINIDIPPETAIYCHQAHAFSLFNNLMINALDALNGAECKTIAIKAGPAEDKYIRIEFADSGTGIPQENIPRVFDAFFSTKPNTGTGLGLAIVKKITELYGGDIKIKSELDKGTKFIILMSLLESDTQA